jgi:hypothetical protein
MIDDFFGAGAGVFAHSLFQQMLVFRFLYGFQNQRRIGGRITRVYRL